jgi:hypothetical protein
MDDKKEKSTDIELGGYIKLLESTNKEKEVDENDIKTEKLTAVELSNHIKQLESIKKTDDVESISVIDQPTEADCLFSTENKNQIIHIMNRLKWSEALDDKMFDLWTQGKRMLAWRKDQTHLVTFVEFMCEVELFYWKEWTMETWNKFKWTNKSDISTERSKLRASLKDAKKRVMTYELCRDECKEALESFTG